MEIKEKLTHQVKVFLITLGISIFLLSLGIISHDLGVVGNAFILSAFLIAIPQLFLRYEKYRDLKEMETKFPLFLRDMIENVRSGMPFHRALIVISKIDYGKLSREIRKTANQLSWGMPFDKAMDQLAERLKSSKRLYTALKTIRESYLSGGDVVSTLESVSDTSIALEESEVERKSLLNQYVILMYAICFLFVGIVAAINKFMVPIFEMSAVAGSEVTGIINPCDTCIGFACTICSLFHTACYAFSISTANIACYYTSLFFFMSIVEAACCGLVAGQISENSIVSGLKHSIIMLVVTFGAFSILVRIGIMGV